MQWIPSWQRSSFDRTEALVKSSANGAYFEVLPEIKPSHTFLTISCGVAQHSILIHVHHDKDRYVLLKHIAHVRVLRQAVLIPAPIDMQPDDLSIHRRAWDKSNSQGPPSFGSSPTWNNTKVHMVPRQCLMGVQLDGIGNRAHKCSNLVQGNLQTYIARGRRGKSGSEQYDRPLVVLSLAVMRRTSFSLIGKPGRCGKMNAIHSHYFG